MIWLTAASHEVATSYAGHVIECSGCLLGNAWRAMYDAALAEKEGK